MRRFPLHDARGGHPSFLFFTTGSPPSLPPSAAFRSDRWSSLVYLQYGPSQPEFLELAGRAAEGFCWSTVLGVYADERGNAFRAKYKERFPGIMGLVYTGNGYDIAYYLKAAWEATGDPSDFAAVCEWIRTNPYRGVCGYMDMNNEFQEAAHFPDNGFAVTATELEKGMSQLYVQVQDVEHRSSSPTRSTKRRCVPAPWWGDGDPATCSECGSPVHRPPLFACDDIALDLGGREILRNISLTVGPGEVLGIIGPNGAGKTSLLEVLSGRMAPKSGSVRLKGKPITAAAAAFERARLGIGRTYQTPVVPEELTVGETFKAARQAYRPYLTPLRRRVGRANWWALRWTRTCRPRRLETFDRRKLLLACLLMRRPSLLLMDEPAAGLINSEVDEIDHLVRLLSKEMNIAIVIVEHRIELLDTIADRVVVMDAGEVIARGAGRDPRRPRVHAAYFESRGDERGARPGATLLRNPEGAGLPAGYGRCGSSTTST